MQLERIVLEFRAGELIARVLYRSSLDAPNAGTKARARQVSDLTRAGLAAALEALDEGETTMCGTSGYTTREDLLVVDTKDATIASESGAEAEGSAA